MTSAADRAADPGLGLFIERSAKAGGIFAA